LLLKFLNMYGLKKQEGFTITEVLVAVLIMGLGFLAMAEMEFLALRQKQRAEEGTVATNVIQFIADRDMAEVKRRHLYNSIVYMDAQAGKTYDLSYCNGSSGNSVCNSCPCNPLEFVISELDNGTVENTCAVVDLKDSDPDKVVFRNTLSDCNSDAASMREGNRPFLYVVKRAEAKEETINGIKTLTVSINYAVKTEAQFEDTGFSVDISDSLASQVYEITAHQSDYSNFVPGWNEVFIPHIP